MREKKQEGYLSILPGIEKEMEYESGTQKEGKKEEERGSLFFIFISNGVEESYCCFCAFKRKERKDDTHRRHPSAVYTLELLDILWLSRIF